MANSLGISFLKGVGEELNIQIVSKADIISEAATGAIRDLVPIWKDAARAEISKAGFSSRWTKPLSVKAYPDQNGKFSLRAAASLHHKIPYAGIFDKGNSNSTIQGHPFLWVPLPNIAKLRVGRQRMSPAALIGKGAKLRTINRPGKPPLLAERLRVQGSTDGAALASIKWQLQDLTHPQTTGTAGSGRLVNVPLFVGIPQVTLKKRFDIGKTAVAVRSQLPALYAKNADRVIAAANAKTGG